MANVSLPVIARILVSTCGSTFDAKMPTSCHVSFWLLRTCPFILLFIGTIGNVLTLAVLLRHQMRKQPTTIYLVFLTLSDSNHLWNGLIRSTLVHGWTKDIRTMSAFVCATQEFMLHVCGLLSCTLMAAISVERMLLTTFPIAARTKITRRNAMITSIVLLTISVLLAVHLPFGKTLQESTQKSSNNETEDVTIWQCTFVSTDYLTFYKDEWPMMRLVYLSVLPSLVMFCCNFVIVWQLFLQRRRIKPAENNPSTAARNERSKSLTRMCIIIAVYYLLTSIPFGVYIAIISGLPNNTADEELPIYFLGYLVIYYSVMTNYAFNFFFYFGSGPLFKRHLITIWHNLSTGLRRMFGFKVEVTEAEHVAPVSTARETLVD